MDMTLGTWRVSIHRIPPTSAELAALYNHAAHYWQGAIRRLGFLRAYADLFARLQDDGALGALQPGAWALDCGIGMAACRLALAEQLGTPVRIAGIDIAPQMLDQAQHALDAAAVPADLRCADVRDLPFADQTFDLVVSAYMLEHLVDPRGAAGDGARPAARRSAPGCRYLPRHRRRAPGLEIPQRRDRASSTYQLDGGRRSGGCARVRHHGWRVGRALDERRLRRAQAGAVTVLLLRRCIWTHCLKGTI